MGEVLLAQFAAQLLLIIGQIALVLLVAFGMFSNLFEGGALPYGLLCLAQGVCGMWYGECTALRRYAGWRTLHCQCGDLNLRFSYAGLLTAVIFDSTTAASLVGTGSYFTLMFCSSKFTTMCYAE